MKPRHPSGIALLEAMLALALFGLVTVSLVGALQNMTLLAVESTQQTSAIHGMRSLMEESLRGPSIETGTQEIGPDEMGILYQVSVTPDLTQVNENGLALPDLYLIEVSATWQEGNRRESLTAETLRNVQLYP